ncbi:MAG: dehydrogenase [Ponticaulis sp.]|nr:dehydrogenase [Ponticaulis sp.]
MRKRALITGASAGIGAAFAEHYAERECDLVLTARRKDRLERLAATLKRRHGCQTEILVSDLADPNAPSQLVSELGERGISIDILINNAGYGLPGTFQTTSWPDQQTFLQVLLVAPTELCHHLLPDMIERGYGRIINVASLAGFMPGGSGHTLYGPVKAAMIRLSESLNAETSGQGVYVTALCPGLTYSEFHDVNGQRDSLSKVPGFMWQTADEVVKAACRANEANRPVIVTGVANKILASTNKLLPDAIGRALMKEQATRFRKKP